MKKIIISFWVLVLILILSLVINHLLLAPKSHVSETIENNEKKLTRIENSGYYTDGSNIFYSFTGDQILSGADINTFTTLGHGIAKDARHVYVGNNIQSGIDPESFIRYSFDVPVRLYVSFFIDKNGTYYAAQDKAEGLVIKPSPFDPRKVTFVGNYIKSENGIYATDYDTLIRLDGVNPATFRVLGICYSVETSRGYYMADKNHIYVGADVLQGADPEAFKQIAVIKNGPNEEIPYSMTLWKDSHRIYAHCGVVIKEADYSTFEYLGDNKAQDKTNFYSLHTGGGYNVTPRK